MTFQSDLFKGKTVVVTGGTQGIGAGIAQQFAALGARVVAAGLAPTDAQRDALGNGIEVAALDVADAASTAALFATLDTLDVLVNCAGMIRRGDEHDIETFERVIAVNLNGTMRMCSAARPLLAKTRGAIVNTASMLTFFGGGLVPAYSASKGGVAQLTKSLAIAYAADGIRVNAVAPGVVDTPMHKNDSKEALQSLNPMGVVSSVRDIVDAVMYLTDAATVTGDILYVDGGAHFGRW